MFFQQLKEALLADLGTTQEEEEHLLKLRCTASTVTPRSPNETTPAA